MTRPNTPACAEEPGASAVAATSEREHDADETSAVRVALRPRRGARRCGRAGRASPGRHGPPDDPEQGDGREADRDQRQEREEVEGRPASRSRAERSAEP